MKATDFDKRFDNGEDITKYLEYSGSARTRAGNQESQR